MSNYDPMALVTTELVERLKAQRTENAKVITGPRGTTAKSAIQSTWNKHDRCWVVIVDGVTIGSYPNKKSRDKAIASYLQIDWCPESNVPVDDCVGCKAAR